MSVQSKLIFLLWIIPFFATAKITLPKIFCDHMVIQREVVVPVWGWADVEESIEIVFKEKAYQTIADDNGEWSIELPSMKAGGPFEMQLNGANGTQVIKDIWIGDVWLCSGQSNMEWLVINSNDAKAEIANAKDSKIRHFKVPLTTSYSPEADLVGGEWETCSPKTVDEFTAVGYFFARSLRAHHDVPIGLLNSSWGGSRIEPWMSSDALGYESIESAGKELKASSKIKEDKLRAFFKNKMGTIPTKDEGLINGAGLWAATDYDDTKWMTMELPGVWEDRGWPKMDGIVWFRKTVFLTEKEVGKGITLHLGKIDDSDITWMNGKVVGGMKNAWNEDRIYKVEAKDLQIGKNVITIRIEDEGYNGGLYGKAESLAYHSSDQVKSLAGEWKYKIAKVDLNLALAPNHTPTLLYNQMIHPILKFPIKGAIWYQGESNAGGQDAIDYRAEFPKMIEDWRQRWSCGDFPFLFVQLANFLAPDLQPSQSDWAILRESQSKTLSVPNTGQAVIIDIGDADDIHPRNKQDVGLRLALAARHLAYQEELVYSGPVYKSMKIEGNQIRLQFKHEGSGLIAKDKYGYLKSFAIAGADQKFVWAKARLEGNEVIVWSDNIVKPVAVRYGWGNNPDDANLYNKENLPASPFRTDTWK